MIVNTGRTAKAVGSFKLVFVVLEMPLHVIMELPVWLLYI